MRSLVMGLALVLAAGAQGAVDQAAYDAAFAQAKSAGRPVIVVAAAPSWDEDSGKLVAAVSAPELEGWLARETVLVRLDPSVEGADGARSFAAAQLESLGVTEVPSLAVYEPSGAELGRVSFAAQSSEELERALVTMIQGRRDWRARLARLDTEAADARLIDAAHLMRHCAPVLGRDLVRVAGVLFALDRDNTSGLRAEAAMMVASGTGADADAAVAYLESIAASDPEKRYGFVMWAKSGHTLERLMQQQALVKAKQAPAQSLRAIAVELIAQVNRARPHAPNDDIRGQLMVRAAVAFKLVGEPAKAEAALGAARTLAARYAAENKNADTQVAAIP